MKVLGKDALVLRAHKGIDHVFAGDKPAYKSQITLTLTAEEFIGYLSLPNLRDDEEGGRDAKETIL